MGYREGGLIIISIPHFSKQCLLLSEKNCLWVWAKDVPCHPRATSSAGSRGLLLFFFSGAGGRKGEKEVFLWIAQQKKRNFSPMLQGFSQCTSLRHCNSTCCCPDGRSHGSHCPQEHPETFLHTRSQGFLQKELQNLINSAPCLQSCDFSYLQRELTYGLKWNKTYNLSSIQSWLETCITFSWPGSQKGSYYSSLVSL